MLAAALLVLVAGLAIGATSIGGVLVVPVLTALAGVEPQRAVAAASLAFALPGVAALIGSLRGGSARSAGDQHGGGGLVIGASALAGAALGALTLAWLPVGGVKLAVALIALASGGYALLGRERSRPVALHAAALLPLGALVGCLSAWSGTGGPVVLLPLLALWGVPAAQAVDAAQRIQLPVALAATAVNFVAGRLDVALGLGIGVLVLAGWFGGRALARRLPTRRLRQAVAVALIGTGLAYL
jgi:uncharacterized membrane protein YfcA